MNVQELAESAVTIMTEVDADSGVLLEQWTAGNIIPDTADTEATLGITFTDEERVLYEVYFIGAAREWVSKQG